MRASDVLRRGRRPAVLPQDIDGLLSEALERLVRAERLIAISGRPAWPVARIRAQLRGLLALWRAEPTAERTWPD